MKASSESGLCAMVISRTGAETDEDDISKILQHSNFNAGRKRKTLRKNYFCQEANKIADCSPNLCLRPLDQATARGEFPQVTLARGRKNDANASANATTWHIRPPKWLRARGLRVRTRPSSAIALRIPDPLRTGGGKRPLDPDRERLSMRLLGSRATLKSPLQQRHQPGVPISQNKEQQERNGPIVAASKSVHAHGDKVRAHQQFQPRHQSEPLAVFLTLGLVRFGLHAVLGCTVEWRLHAR